MGAGPESAQYKMEQQHQPTIPLNLLLDFPQVADAPHPHEPSFPVVSVRFCFFSPTGEREGGGRGVRISQRRPKQNKTKQNKAKKGGRGGGGDLVSQP